MFYTGCLQRLSNQHIPSFLSSFPRHLPEIGLSSFQLFYWWFSRQTTGKPNFAILKHIGTDWNRLPFQEKPPKCCWSSLQNPSKLVETPWKKKSWEVPTRRALRVVLEVLCPGVHLEESQVRHGCHGVWRDPRDPPSHHGWVIDALVVQINTKSWSSLDDSGLPPWLWKPPESAGR